MEHWVYTVRQSDKELSIDFMLKFMFYIFVLFVFMRAYNDNYQKNFNSIFPFIFLHIFNDLCDGDERK